MCRTKPAASALGIPAAVMNSGRIEDPRRTGTAWVAVRNRDLATPITGMPNSACAWTPRPAAVRVQVGVAVDDEQAQPAQAGQDCAQRRELAQVELSRLVGRYLGDDRGAFGQHAGEGGIGGHNGRRPGTAGLGVVHVHGGA